MGDNQENDRFLNNQFATNGDEFSDMERISRIRIMKEIQYLSKTSVSYQIDGQKIKIFGMLEEPLYLLIPLKYPFEEPSYSYKSKQNLVSEVLQFWVPKFKLLEMIELVAANIKARHQIESQLSKFTLYRIFNEFDSLSFVLLISILIRALVALGGYSGHHDWPNLGDFQAHRNWMSITINRNMSNWYQSYEGHEVWWPIDYPPVAAYLSYVFGIVWVWVQPQSMVLQRGYQSAILTSYMRFTALAIEVLVLFPVYYALNFLEKKPSAYANIALLAILIRPDVILIDHGHFQYNSLILGLILWAYYFLINRKFYLCCFLFTVAINAKQMASYYALAFFACLIGMSWIQKRPWKIRFCIELAKYGCIVIGTTLTIWLPWLHDTQMAKNILQAIFPIHRGLYQLKVGNFWCISDVLINWEDFFSKGTLMMICLVLCVVFSMPALSLLIVNPCRKSTDICFFVVALTFFMFSYHVHQKSILLPIAFSFLAEKHFNPHLIHYFVVAGCLGMYHLLKEDGQSLQYFLIIFLYCFFKESKINLDSAQNSKPAETWFSQLTESFLSAKITKIGFYFTISSLHILQATVLPPQHLPYLFHLFFAFFSFILNSYILGLANLTILAQLSRVHFTIQKRLI